MKFKKVLLFALTSLLATSCAGLFGDGEGDADVNLYHLTLSSNLELNEEQKAGLKATLGFGEPGLEVKYGARPEDEIEALKSDGAKETDIEKAGKRQSDGTYYFFDQDPIYLEAPSIEGYKLDGFYDKATGELADRANVQGPSDNRFRTRWNMFNKDTELEARYAEVSYEITFDNMEDGDINPNISITDYKFSRDGKNKVLEPATTTSKLKTFVCWQYQDISFDGPNAPWIEIVDGKLPCDYALDYMRIAAKWDVKQLKISFDFKEYIDSETINDLTYSNVIESMSIQSNLAKVDGVVVPSGEKVSVTENSVIELDGENGWMTIFYTLKPGHDVFYFSLNGERNDSINASYMEPPYISINGGDLTEDSTISFVLSIAD